jgi:cold shock CspA family protein
MAKAMVFIDGTWLYFNTPKLGRAYGQGEYHVDFGKLPRVLAGEVGSQLGSGDIDLVRTYLFGSYASNYDPCDNDAVQRRRDFFSLLKEEYHYEVELYPVNFMGRRLRRQDRDPGDDFEPREKCVDIALATAMLYFGAVPYAYDIAIAVIGDQDFKPVLQHVRQLGKRVAIASIRDSCAPDLSDQRDEARVKDFDIIWLDDLLQKLELKFERHQRLCDSPTHKGPRLVWTTFRPRKGQKFYCDVCREEFSKQRQEAQLEIAVPAEPATGPDAPGDIGVGMTATGVVKKKFTDHRQFGFIQGAEGDYFFHLVDLEPGLDYDAVSEGMEVEFEVRKRPVAGRNGNVQNVRRRPG